MLPGGERGMLRQIYLQGCDRQVAFKSGVKVSAIAVVFGRTCAANPLHRLPARAGLGDHTFSRMSTPQARDAKCLDLIHGATGYVHIQQPR